MKLAHHISSQYMTAANALRSEKSRRKIIAYVESYDDVLFWRTVLRRFENEKQFFEIMLPTKEEKKRTVLGRGKRSAIGSLLQNTGHDMIACVDADYDYLLQGASEGSRALLHTPYVFHTFAYSIENLPCYAKGLHDVCVMTTLNDRRVFDFELFLKRYSEEVWPLFCWSVALYRKFDYHSLSITDMDNIISPGRITIGNTEEVLKKLRGRVKHKIGTLRQNHPRISKTITQTEQSLRSLGLSPETTYLFIHGHSLFDKLVVPLLKAVCRKLIEEREQEIRLLAIHKTQLSNELSCYNNSIGDTVSMLKKSTAYTESPLFAKIINQFAPLFKPEEQEA